MLASLCVTLCPCLCLCVSDVFVCLSDVIEFSSIGACACAPASLRDCVFRACACVWFVVFGFRPPDAWPS